MTPHFLYRQVFPYIHHTRNSTQIYNKPKILSISADATIPHDTPHDDLCHDEMRVNRLLDNELRHDELHDRSLLLCFAAGNSERLQQSLESILTVKASVCQPPFFLFPVRQAVIVESFFAVLNEKWHDVVTEALF